MIEILLSICTALFLFVGILILVTVALELCKGIGVIIKTWHEEY